MTERDELLASLPARVIAIERLAEWQEEVRGHIQAIDGMLDELRNEREDSEFVLALLRQDDDAQDDEAEALEADIDRLDEEIDALEAERTDATLELLQIENVSRELLTAWNASVA